MKGAGDTRLKTDETTLKGTRNKEEMFNNVKHIVITCPLCGCGYDIKKYKKSQHEKSQLHQRNLEASLNKNKTPTRSLEHPEYLESLQPIDVIQ